MSLWISKAFRYDTSRRTIVMNVNLTRIGPSFVLPQREVAILTLSVAALAGMSFLVMFVCN